MPTASIKLSIDNNNVVEASVGIGPVDAAINAVKKSIADFDDIELIEYHVDAITGGTNALIDVIIKLKKEIILFQLKGTEPDIIDASVKAYIAGLNRLINME